MELFWRKLEVVCLYLKQLIISYKKEQIAKQTSKILGNIEGREIPTARPRGTTFGLSVLLKSVNRRKLLLATANVLLISNSHLLPRRPGACHYPVKLSFWVR